MLRLAHIKNGQALRNSDQAALKQADDYIALHSAEFTDRVSSPALASQKIKGNSLHEFPDEEDLQTLKHYQLKMIDQLIGKLRASPNATLWRHLADIVLSRLINFNARRGSEAAELLVSEYLKKSNKVDASVAASLSDVEQKLLSR